MQHYSKCPCDLEGTATYVGFIHNVPVSTSCKADLRAWPIMQVGCRFHFLVRLQFPESRLQKASKTDAPDEAPQPMALQQSKFVSSFPGSSVFMILVNCATCDAPPKPNRCSIKPNMLAQFQKSMPFFCQHAIPCPHVHVCTSTLLGTS